MSAFTLSAGGTTNWDTLSGGSTNATLDTYVLSNASVLLIDTDSYQCANHSAAFGSLDSVSFSGIGGTVRLDGTSVRVVPFNTGAGTVPAIGTAISKGGVSAALLGVWADWQSEPLAAGAAMPSSGYIKVKGKTGGNFSAGALTGISASATGPDVVGWIEVRGADTAQLVLPRIGSFEAVGEWFELGATSGSRGQVLPCPTTGTVAGVFAAIWVETSAGSGVYEQFVGMGSVPASASTPTDERGKVFWQTTSGIVLGSDGTNNVGYLPPAGCKVRIPNVIMTCCTRTAGSGSGPRVLPNATLATRQEFATTAAGSLSISKSVCQWYANFAQAYQAFAHDSVFSDTLVLTEIATPLDIDNIALSQTQAQVNVTLSLQSCTAGGSLQNSTFAAYNIGSNKNLIQFNKGLQLKGNRFVGLQARGSNSFSMISLAYNSDCTYEDNWVIGGRIITQAESKPLFKNHHHADNFAGTTQTANAQYAIDFTNGSSGIVLDGLDFKGLTNVHAYLGVVSFTACVGAKVRNIGSAAAPLDLGSTNASGTAIVLAGGNSGIKLQRIYAVNTRLGLYSTLNDDDGVVIENMAGDYADTSVIAARNALVKGAKLTGATSGQTAQYGTHWKDSFTSATVGKIEILCNEPTALSAAQCAATGGTPRFNSAGQVLLTAVGDQVTWEMPYFALGHTALANLAATLTGTNTGNLTYEFQADLGAGYGGTWLTLNAANLNAQGAITPTTGVRLKVRATCATASASNALTNIAIPTVTTSTDQDTLYPLDANTVTFTGLPTGTDVVVLAAGSSTILAQQDSNAGTSYAFTYAGAQSVDVGFVKPGYEIFYIRGLALAAADSSIPVALRPDRNYS